MKNLLLIILSFACFNICFGQSELLFKKNPHQLIRNHEVIKPGFPQNRFLGDFNEQVDSSRSRQYADEQIGWATSGTSQYTYTNEHLLATESNLDIDLDNGEIYRGRQYEYYYNDAGLWTLQYYNNLNVSTGEWMRADRWELIWNEDLQATDYITSKWNDTLQQFEYTSKSSTTYTLSNQADEHYYYSWDGDHWKTEGKNIYEYNNADSIQEINIYNWNEGSGEWELEYKEEYYYTNDIDLDSIIDYWDMGLGLEPYSKLILMVNGQGLLESDIYYQWSGSNWDPSALTEYEYNPDGRESLYTYYEWDEDEERFVEDVYEETTFTTAGDPKRMTYAEYDPDVEAWVPWEATEIFYDENVDGSTIVWPSAPDYETVSYHQKPIFLVTSFYFDQWYDVDTTLLFYGNLTSATIPVSKLNANVYPNPCSDQLTIQMEELGPGSTITFFDQQGKLISSRPVRSNVPVSISGLIPGAYVYRIRNGTEFYSGKIIKE